MTLNSIVIDSNALQRMDTVKKANDHDAVNLLAEFSSCIEAKEFLNNTEVDLIFLEIDIPKMGGFEFLDILNASKLSVPKIIIISKRKRCRCNQSKEQRERERFREREREELSQQPRE